MSAPDQPAPGQTTPGLSAPPGSRPPTLPPGFVLMDGVAVAEMPGTAMADPVSHVTALRDMDMRPDDVLICAIPKAGTHWVWEMTSMLIKGKAEHDPNAKEVVMLEFIPLTQFQDTPSPRVLNSHLPYRLLPKQVSSKKTKIVYVSRNPKDTAVSTYHHMKRMTNGIGFEGSFSEFLRTTLLVDLPPNMLDWFWMTLDWEQVMNEHPEQPILHLNYEDMKEDLEREVGRLAEFLGVGAGEELIKQVAQACDFSAMKQAESTKHNPFQDFFKPGYTMYRKGQVGDWKNWFSVAENEIFDELYARKMANSKLQFRFTQ